MTTCHKKVKAEFTGLSYITQFTDVPAGIFGILCTSLHQNLYIDNIRTLHFIFISEQTGDHFKFSSLFTTTISTSNLPSTTQFPFIISSPPVSPSIMRAFRNCQIQHHLTSNITSESFNSTPILTTFPSPTYHLHIYLPSISLISTSSPLSLPHLDLDLDSKCRNI